MVVVVVVVVLFPAPSVLILDVLVSVVLLPFLSPVLTFVISVFLTDGGKGICLMPDLREVVVFVST